MDFIQKFSNRSDLKFRFVSNYTNAQLWDNLYEQCEIANKQIDKRYFSVNKLKKKLNNVLHLVKIYNTLFIKEDPQSLTHSICINTKKSDYAEEEEFNDCSNCQILSEHIEELENQVETKSQLLSKLCYGKYKNISVITRQQSGKDESYVPETSICIESQDDEEESSELPSAEISKRKWINNSAKLKLKIHDQLIKILKDVPAYNDKMDAFHNADIFESNTDKYNLTNEQKNKLFKVWLPSHMAKRLQASPRMVDDEVYHSTDTDRLRQLILFTTGETTPTVDLLDSLKVSMQDDPFAFLVTFEQAYKIIMCNSGNFPPEVMIKAFVKKFKYLDPVSVQIASEKPTLQEATAFIDRIRRSMKQNNVKAKISIVQGKLGKTEVRPKLGNQPKRTVPYLKNKKVFFHNKPVVCYHCEKPGHLKWQCRRFLREQTQERNPQRVNFQEGKENGFVPTGPPSSEQTKIESPYASLIRQVRELTLSNESPKNLTHVHRSISERVSPSQ